MPVCRQRLPLHTAGSPGIIAGLSYFRDITVETYPSW